MDNDMQEHKTNYFAKLSLLSIALTVIFASITHAYQFGYRAFVAGAIMIVILSVLNMLYQRAKNKMIFVLYALLNAWVIIGLGIINGFWNHAFKTFLNYLHGGYLPPFLAGLFIDPKIGSFLLEGAGILTFVASMIATYYILKMIPRKHNSADNTEII